MAASASTERNTCRRLAPTIRSRASSRVRWPTVMENVLKMVNAPTKSEMKAKHQQGSGEERQILVDRARLLVEHGLAGNHLCPVGQVPGYRLLHGRLVGSRDADDVDVVHFPHLVERLLRLGEREGGESNAGQVVSRAELGEARDREGLRSPPSR